MPFNAGVISLFPDMFSKLADYGVFGRALRENKVTLQCWNPRDYAEGDYGKVDDRPYGGGAGMVLKADILGRTLERARGSLGEKTRFIYLSAQGRPVEQKDISRMASWGSALFLAGRYEGVDERFLEDEVDEEWTLGDFVLSGGELPVLCVIDAVARLLPGVVGDPESVENESFSDGLLEHPHYTRPEQYNGSRVPDVLLSGDHGNIERWRQKQSLGRTWQRRPDLLSRKVLSQQQRDLLEEYIDENVFNTSPQEKVKND